MRLSQRQKTQRRLARKCGKSARAFIRFALYPVYDSDGATYEQAAYNAAREAGRYARSSQRTTDEAPTAKGATP